MQNSQTRLFTVVLFLIAFAVPAPAQQGWIPTRVGPAGRDLNTVFFLDSKRGWVGGDGGFLTRTDDGGNSWVSQTVDTPDAVNDIYFRDKEIGFVLAGNAIFPPGTRAVTGPRYAAFCRENLMARTLSFTAFVSRARRRVG